MADEILGQVTITYNGPGDLTLHPSTGHLDRDVQTMKWTLIDQSGLHATFKVPGGIVFPWPPPSPPPVYSKWKGTIPEGNETEYSANANDVIPHGDPPKVYAYDIHIMHDSTSDLAGARGEDVISVHDVQKNAAQKRQLETIDPPVDNQPLP